MPRKLLSIFMSALCLVIFSAGFSTADAAEITIKVNATFNPKSHGDMPLVRDFQAFEEKMEARFPGRVEVRLYWDESLGKTHEASMNALQNNVFHLQFYPMTSLSEYTKAAIPFTNLFLVPYPHTQIVYNAFDGEIGQMVTERMVAETRVRPVAFLDIGFRHLLNNRGPVTSLADLKDMKYRVQPNPVHLASFKALQTNPTPVAISELFTALQQRVVDGTENPLENIMVFRLYEVQKYLTLSGHAFEMGCWAMGDQFYQKLPADVREGMHEILAEITADHRAYIGEKNDEFLAYISERMEVNQLSLEQLAQFREIVAPGREVSRQQAGAEYTDKFLSLLDKYTQEYLATLK